MNKSTKGIYIPSVNTLFVVYETEYTPENESNLERLKKIILMKGFDDLNEFGLFKTSGAQNRQLDKNSSRIMTVAQANSLEAKIEEIPLTNRDLKAKEKKLELATKETKKLFT